VNVLKSIAFSTITKRLLLLHLPYANKIDGMATNNDRNTSRGFVSERPGVALDSTNVPSIDAVPIRVPSLEKNGRKIASLCLFSQESYKW
jgi:hypothetical protein